MSENTSEQNNETAAGATGVKLEALYAFKEGMATVYDDKGEAIPVTVLRYEPFKISQIKTVENDGYEAVQVAGSTEKLKNTDKSQMGHLKAAGFDSGAKVIREVRQKVPAGATVGSVVSIESLAKGDIVKITSRSKGKGFQGSIRRWNFAGGPATHGSKFHRRPGSSGNRTWPGRVMPGKKFPGHLGDETVTVKNVVVVDVLVNDGVLIVKGPVPGSKNSLVRLVKG